MNSVLVAQLGARMHYAVPRVLHEAGMLDRLCTDICAVKGWPKLLKLMPRSLRPAGIRRLLGRIPHGVPLTHITTFNDFGQEYARRRAAATSASEATAAYLWAGKKLCEQVLESGLGQSSSVYTFNSAGLELLEHARARGSQGIMEQTIAPYKIERELITTEQTAFPDWEPPVPDDEFLQEFIAREEAEWECASLILCGSDFVREGIARCGGPAERCVVVPYGVELPGDVPVRAPHDGPLRVLTVGAVGLRKGSPYVLAAAQRLKGRAHFRMVGSIGVLPEALAKLHDHVEVVGPVPRPAMAAHYQWADVFLLPSICEGSATASYEAMTHGLPVIATPNAGTIVRDGVEGFILPIRDAHAIAEKLELLARTPKLRASLSLNARQLSERNDVRVYGRRLLDAIKRSSGSNETNGQNWAARRIKRTAGRAILVAQLGGRRHYAIPRMLYAAGMLDRFFTDICAVKGWPQFLNRLPGALRVKPIRRLLGRVPQGVPLDRITAFTDFGREYASRRARANSASQAAKAYLWAGRTFCERIIKNGLGRADTLYTFNSAGLELLRCGRKRGLRTIMEQTIAPMRLERELLRQEEERFPDWQEGMLDRLVANDFITREEAEWQEADLILCGSDFVREGIKHCGGPTERCAVVPYGVDTNFRVPKRPEHDGPLRVLTVGEIGLRKGSPYVLEAASLLRGRSRFRMVGSNNLGAEAARQLQTHIEVIGPVPRSEILAHYAWADVFLLPSLCEGSATVTYEAMACGLPVIATPNTGSTVRDGVEGFIVPIRDGQGIAGRLELLIGNPSLLSKMRENARLAAKENSLVAYSRRLTQAIGQGVNASRLKQFKPPPSPAREVNHCQAAKRAALSDTSRP